MSITLHRFTPPTCTLEIKGVKSLLSRWTDRELLKKFQFQLSFDDPRLPPDEQITITGNKTELEKLNIAVNDYIQNHLHAFLNPNSQSIDNPSGNYLPYLQADGLVNHQLFLANLKNDAADNKVKLSTVQLFDLVTALESYSTQVAASPELNQAKSRKIVPLWGGIAAVTVAAVGIATISLQSPRQNVATSTKPQSPTKTIELNEVVPPEIPETAKRQTPQPKLNEPLSSTTRLPPPPAVDTPKPKPNIPDPADYPLSQVGRQSGLDKLAENKQTESTITPSPSPKKANPAQKSDSETIILEQNKTEGSTQLKTEIADNSDRNLGDNDDSILELPQDIAIPDPNSNIALNSPSKKLSQLQEIENYFQEKWQPADDLKQSLEYRLYLNSDGSIKRVIPLGKASKLYLSKTNIPVQGQPFISPNGEQKSTIRLLLDPDGGVKVFAE